ncbi:hypothetical protein Mapa_006953 [Marchantia paleacea]|nr:hypothetical protein Mapa_006953 [Marchantia paleacea]
MCSSCASLACVLLLVSVLCIEAKELVSPNFLVDGQFLQEGVWIFLNQGCSLTLSENKNVYIQTYPSDFAFSSNSTCTLTMATTGDLILTRDGDGGEEFNSYTSAIVGVHADAFLLNLRGNGALTIEGSDYTIVLTLYSP